MNVQLNVSTAVEIASLNKAKLVKFNITALVIYGPADVRRLAAGTLGKKEEGE